MVSLAPIGLLVHHGQHVWVLLFAVGLARGIQQAAISLRPVGDVRSFGEQLRTGAGEIQRLTVDRFGTVYVITDGSSEVRILDAAGRTSASVGGGDGSLSLPAAMLLGSDDRLYVLDPRLQRVVSFTKTSHGMAASGSFRLDFAAHDMCTIGSRLYLLGLREGHLIHSFTAGGRLVASFGAAEKPRHRILGPTLARGRLECIEKSRLIILQPQFSGAVLAFSVRGTQVWTTELRGYRKMVIGEKPDGSVTFAAPTRGVYHQPRAMLYLAPSYVAVQLGEYSATSRSKREHRRLDTRLLDMRTGRELSSQTGLPILLAADSSRVWGMSTRTSRNVAVYRFRISLRISQ